MKYHELKTNPVKSSARVGRGIAAGKGKTAGRGTKGQNARSGGRVRPGFEGGQNPLYMRLPKLPGFRAVKPKAENVYTGQLEQFSGKDVDNQSLYDAGLITSPHTRVKLIVKGDLTKKTTVRLQFASKAAVAQIEKAGGSFEVTEQVARQAKEKAAK